MAKYGNKEAAVWWLRSLGVDSYGAVVVGVDGDVGVDGGDVDDNRGGVRPALWLNR